MLLEKLCRLVNFINCFSDIFHAACQNTLSVIQTPIVKIGSNFLGKKIQQETRIELPDFLIELLVQIKLYLATNNIALFTREYNF